MAIHHGSSLSALPVGGKGLVVSVEAEGLIRRRLLDLGLVPGTVVESIRRSPAGDPTAFAVRGAVIALRAEEGGLIKVQPL
ncbi:MAG: FeoA family protein [Patescibacteria group bacterium]